MVKPTPYICDEYCDFIITRKCGDCQKHVKKVLSNAFSHRGTKAEFYVNYTKECVKIKVPLKAGERVFETAQAYADGKAIVREREEIVVPSLSIIMIQTDE